MFSAANETRSFLSRLEAELLRGEALSIADAHRLLSLPDPEPLYELAHRVTEHFMGNAFDTCTICSAKVGNCPEDCKWCAQSLHYNTGIVRQPLVSESAVRDYVRGIAQCPINRFSLVASGRRLSVGEVRKLAAIYSRLKREYPTLHCCASLGLLSSEQLEILRDASVDTYHCNLESAPSFFPSLCSTHTQADKEATIEAARALGMCICCGGILGMGESDEQRIEFAYYLREMGTESIPLNLLQPIAGTPLEHVAPLTEREVLTSIALFRLIHPRAWLRFAGGRMQLSYAQQQKAIYVGINAAITGDFLTTTGQNIATDLELIAKCGKRVLSRRSPRVASDGEIPNLR